jgi:hypothetical protein
VFPNGVPTMGVRMRAGLLAPVLVLATVLVLQAGARSSHAAVSQTLYANFDADGDIAMTFADGTPIGAPSAPGTVIPAGTYQIVLNNNSLDDLGNPHQFHLFGPGVNLSAGQSVQANWTATFQPGSTYVFQDDLNPTTEHEVFGTPGSGATSTTVPPASTTSSGAGSSPSSGKTTSPSSTDVVGSDIKSVPFRGILDGTVTAAGKLTLTSKGKAVSNLKSGRYTFAVVDKATQDGFTVQELRKLPVTVSSVKFVGRRSVSVDLTPGQWLFYATVTGKKNYFVVIG